MFTRFNPLNHGVLYAKPSRLTRFSAWHEHIPFAMLLVDLIRPGTFVELGTHSGDSYCAFCQCVATLDLETRCFAVDTWTGDEHSASYGPEILDDLRAHHDPLYGSFSELVQSTFDQALARFSDGSIDLLHIDGCHTYEAVKHDFNSWLPKLSSRGIVLFHDTAVTGFGFGVKTFWEEISGRYPSLEFYHGNGLGILAVGPEQPESIHEILSASAEDTANIRSLFAAMGRRFALQIDLGRKNDTIQEIRESMGWRILRRLDRANIHLIPPLDAG